MVEPVNRLRHSDHVDRVIIQSAVRRRCYVVFDRCARQSHRYLLFTRVGCDHSIEIAREPCRCLTASRCAVPGYIAPGDESRNPRKKRIGIRGTKLRIKLSPAGEVVLESHAPQYASGESRWYV